MNTQPLWDWVNERHAIYHRKEFLLNGVPLPEGVPSLTPSRDLTRDPILAQYRFCNVFRELDRVTRWIDENIRQPYATHPNLWMMLAIARTVNWPPTLEFLMRQPGAWPLEEDWNPARLTIALEAWKALGNKVYTGAYMIRAESNPKAPWYSWTKQRYIAEIVLGRIWDDRETFLLLLHPHQVNRGHGVIETREPTMKDAWTRFQHPHFIGWGPFMAYQVVVDWRWTHYLRHAGDIQTWSALGPGSRRGLNRLAGRPLDYPLGQDEGLLEMRLIHTEQDRKRAPWVPFIDLSDIQNCLCETDKYLRVKNGEGRPRAQYISGRGY